MAVVRCDKGHYYDDEKFTQCPHCGVLPAMQPEKPVKQKRLGIFHKVMGGAGRQAGAAVPPVQPPVPPAPVQTPPAYDDQTVGISVPMTEMDDNRTVAFSQSPASSYPDDDNRTIAFTHAPSPSVPDDDNRTIAFTHTSSPAYPDDDNRTIAFTHAPSPSVPDDDNRTIAFTHTSSPAYPDDDNRTVAFSHTTSSPISDDDNRTVAYAHTTSSPISDDDNRTMAFSHTTPSSIPDDDPRTIAFTATEPLKERSFEDTVPVVEKPQAAESEAEVQEPEAEEAADQDRTRPEAAEQAAAGQEPVKTEAGGQGAVLEKEKAASAARAVQLPEGRFAAGWLVCVKGEERGIDFRLYKGFNRIGTSSQADIVLAEGDEEEILCAVVYDDRSNQFYVVQQSETPAYRNGEVIQGAVELLAGDILCVGTSEFEFIPFCREGRTWDREDLMV